MRNALLLCAAAIVFLLAAAGCESESEEPGTGASSPTTTTGAGGGTGGTGGHTGGTGGHTGGTGGHTGGTGGSGGEPPPPPDYCTVCQAPTVGGNLANSAIDETSGMMASRNHASILFLHNDSGDSPRFYGIDLSGADQGTFDVTGAFAQDWEDAARGPCPAGACLYFGDFGDNDENRAAYAVYRVPEPSTIGSGSHSVAAETFPFQYPDGSHNCETLLVHPLTGEVVVVQKTGSGPSGIYRFPDPLTVGQTATLTHVGDVTPPSGSNLFTGGDVHPRGHGVLLRTYDRLHFYPMQPGQDIAQALTATPCELPVASEGQGEAVAWTDAGDGYVTVSEGGGVAVNGSACPAP